MMEGFMLYNRLILIALSLVIVIATGCTDVEDGDVTNEITLLTDTSLDLYCEDMGVYPETCVLEDPDNPFFMVSITENVYEEDDEGNEVLVSEGNKFELADDCPSAKSKVYLWATALAKNPSGENQFFTADAFHQLYTEGGSENAREQAIKAYRAVLDHFFYSATYYTADWLPEEPSYGVLLKDLVGARLYDATEVNLEPLYDSPEFGMEALGQWGYVLDVVLEFEYDDNGNVVGIVEKIIVNKIE
jgi:hypothetical protein